MKRVHVCVVVLLLALAPLGVAQALDANGNFLGPVNLPGMDDPLGTVLHKIAAPTSKIAGITCTGDSLWVISYPGAAQVLYEVDPISGATKSTIQLTTTSCYGLGFDTRRNEFVLSASGGTITRVDLKGVVTTQWPSPSGSPIGVAYDPMRDGYWVPDWSNTNMYLVDARNGSVLKSFNIGTQGLTRLAGCGYSPINDLLYTNGRGENKGGIIDPVSGQLLYTVAHPGGTNVGQGAVFFHRWQAPFSGDWNSGANQTIYSYEMGLPRVECNTTVKYGTTLQIKWVSTRDAGRVYKGAAAFTRVRLYAGQPAVPPDPRRSVHRLPERARALQRFHGQSGHDGRGAWRRGVAEHSAAEWRPVFPGVRHRGRECPVRHLGHFRPAKGAHHELISISLQPAVLPRTAGPEKP